MKGKYYFKGLTKMIGKESVSFFKYCIRMSGFIDVSYSKWINRESPLGGKRLMYKTGTLMRSIRISEVNEERVVIESDTPYSVIHNEGGAITVTMQMKKYWWAMYYNFTEKIKKTEKGKVAKTKSNQKISAKAEFCKRMALMKVGSKIKIPKRQYIGESQQLMRKIEYMFFENHIPEIENVIFKKNNDLK